MKARILRALMRGGCVAQSATGVWSVWRTTDLRGAVIAEIEVSDMDELRLSGALKPFGSDENAPLIWCGGAIMVTPQKASADALIKDVERRQQAQSLLLRLLGKTEDEDRKRRLRQAAQDFEGDIERACTRGAASGMNWQALAAGTQIDGGPKRDHGERIGHAGRAATRIEAIMANMGGPEYRLLERMIVRRETRHALAKWRGVRPIDIEREGRDLLQKLADLYDRALKPVSQG